jgi:hypothetical protein
MMKTKGNRNPYSPGKINKDWLTKAHTDAANTGCTVEDWFAMATNADFVIIYGDGSVWVPRTQGFSWRWLSQDQIDDVCAQIYGKAKKKRKKEKMNKYINHKDVYQFGELTMKQIAICYDEDPQRGVMLLKHGSPARINEYAVIARKAFVDGGYTNTARGIKVITLPRGFSAETINHWLDCTGAFGVWLKKQGLRIKND